MLLVVLCELKMTIVEPIQTIAFKNVLRTFENKILKIFKNRDIQPQPKKLGGLTKKGLRSKR